MTFLEGSQVFWTTGFESCVFKRDWNWFLWWEGQAHEHFSRSVGWGEDIQAHALRWPNKNMPQSYIVRCSQGCWKGLRKIWIDPLQTGYQVHAKSVSKKGTKRICAHFQASCPRWGQAWRKNGSRNFKITFYRMKSISKWFSWRVRFEVELEGKHCPIIKLQTLQNEESIRVTIFAFHNQLIKGGIIRTYMSACHLKII